MLANAQLGEYFELAWLLGPSVLDWQSFLWKNPERLLVVTPSAHLVQEGNWGSLFGSDS